MNLFRFRFFNTAYSAKLKTKQHDQCVYLSTCKLSDQNRSAVGISFYIYICPKANKSFSSSTFEWNEPLFMFNIYYLCIKLIVQTVIFIFDLLNIGSVKTLLTYKRVKRNFECLVELLSSYFLGQTIVNLSVCLDFYTWVDLGLLI